MRVISFTTKYKKDLDRELLGKHKRVLREQLTEILELLATDKPLPKRCVDHSLTGEWQDFRDCHVRPDLVLIYKKTNDNQLNLARLGSHSQLGL